MSKPPQRRQCPYSRPLWLLVGTASAIKPELAFRRVEYCLPYSDIAVAAWCGCWFVVYIRRLIYNFCFKYVSFWLQGCFGEWEGLASLPVNHSSWVAVVTPTDQPKSVRSRCIIELFRGVFLCCNFARLTFFFGIRIFVIGVNQILSLFLFVIHSWSFFLIVMWKCDIHTRATKLLPLCISLLLKLTCHHINRRHFCFNIKSISVHPLLWMNVMLDFICMVFAGMWTTFR